MCSRPASFVVAMVIALCGCQAKQVRRSQPLLGSFATISVAQVNDRQRAHQAIDSAFAEIRRIDSLMSVHRPESELSRINRVPKNQWAKVSDDLFLVLTKAMEISKATEGAFDVTIGPLTQLWGFIWKEYRLPSEVELRETLPRVGFQHLELDPATKSIRFKRPGMSIDLGGIAKGYAVDCAMNALTSRGMTNAMVKCGGDLRVSGEARPGQAWEIQIQDSIHSGRRSKLRLMNGALSTAGNYENYFIIDGKRYAHIVDPRHGLPVEGMASCSVIAPTCLESDGWSTALFVYGAEKTLQNFPAMRVLFQRVNIAGKIETMASETFPLSLENTK